MPCFYIKTYGCQMNERDSEALACLLEKRGLAPASSEEDADVIILNTCSVRDQAERKAIGKAGLLKRRKAVKPELVIGIIGCMAQNRGESLLEELPHIDFIAGTDRLAAVPDLVEQAQAGQRLVDLARDTGPTPPEANGHQPGNICAMVSVMRGCDQFCSYCIVPYTRGREHSRSIPDIVAEATRLVEAGTKEILLLGQNITAYGLAEIRRRDKQRPPSDQSPFADLLEALNDVPGLARIRFTSPHVSFMNDRFIDAVCQLPKVCKAFHIPLQSGSDRILSMMRRSYTATEYRDRIAAIRSRLPEVAFSTDVIVGFPTETDEDFRQTRELMAEVAFDMAYIFRYSPRTGTKAAEKFPDDVPEEIKHERNQALLNDLEQAAIVRNRSFQGRVLEVLVEGVSKRNPDRWTGRCDLNKTCNFAPTPGLEPGMLAPFRVLRTSANSLFGEIVLP
jgi:tRNA-2-methylthio-N6-dimethylallyladenosine synthase